jgi:ABC-type nitrate/sulfonate/bicarbonate transport system substrate-binding protein
MRRIMVVRHARLSRLTRRWGSILGALLLLVVVSAASGGAGLSGRLAAAGAPPPTTVVAAVGNNFNHLPALVGGEKGIFLSQGIDLHLQVLPTGRDMSHALQEGKIQFMATGVSVVPVAREAGLPVVGVVGGMHDATTPRADSNVAIVGRGDRGLAADRPESMLGKRLGTIAGGAGQLYLDALLDQLQLGRDQVTVVNVPPGRWLPALASGEVDGVVVWEPYVTQIRDALPETVVVKRGGGLYGYFVLFSTTEQLVAEQPDLVKRFVTALAESQRYVRQHPDEAAEISTRWVPDLDLSTARKAIPLMPFDPRLSKHSLQNYEEAVQDLLMKGLLRSPVPSGQALAPRFIDEVLAERPELVEDLSPIP